MSHDGPILALATPRQTAEFLTACGVAAATRLVVADLEDEQHREELVDEVVSWARDNPHGAVVSLSDHPSVIHGLARARAPHLASLTGASLPTILATLDKAWARSAVVPEHGNVPWGLVRGGDVEIPSVEGADELFFKPLDGCASVGVEKVGSGDPRPHCRPRSGWLTELQQAHLGELPYSDDAVGLVESYVGPEIPRVSVDGWIDADGTIVPVAISDNVYAADEPERFEYQRFPSRLSPAEQWACWELYRQVADRLVDNYGLRSQPFDVEMFATRDLQGVPRPTVMEVNARMHPNITPILHRAFDGLDLFRWHQTGPTDFRANGTAGVIFYVWTDGPAPDWSAVRRRLDGTGFELCAWDSAGPRSGARTCWGWLYLFGRDVEELVSIGRAVVAPARGVRNP